MIEEICDTKSSTTLPLMKETLYLGISNKPKAVDLNLQEGFVDVSTYRWEQGHEGPKNDIAGVCTGCQKSLCIMF